MGCTSGWLQPHNRQQIHSNNHINVRFKSNKKEYVTDNIVNGEPLLYFFNESSIIIENKKITHLTCIYCKNFTIKNNNISHGDGIYFPYSSNNTLIGNNMYSNNDYGAYIWNSDYNTLTGNNIKSNNEGVSISGSSNTLTGNHIYSDSDYGVYINGDNNTLTGNHITHSSNGVFLYSGDHNTLTSNNISLNYYGVYIYYSDYHTLIGNNITNNNYGLSISGSFNTLIGNNIYSNKDLNIRFNSEQHYVEDNTVNGILLLYFFNSSSVIIEGTRITNLTCVFCTDQSNLCVLHRPI